MPALSERVLDQLVQSTLTYTIANLPNRAVQGGADAKRRFDYKITVVRMGCVIAIGLGCVYPTVAWVFGGITYSQFLYSLQFSVAILIGLSGVYSSIAHSLAEKIQNEVIYDIAIKFMTEISQTILRNPGIEAEINAAAGPPTDQSEKEHDVWELVEAAIEGKPITNLPLVEQLAFDTISGEEIASGSHVYILDDDLYSPVSAVTLSTLFLRGATRSHGKNPFTNLPVRQIRKVIVRYCSPFAEGAARKEYEAAMRPAADLLQDLREMLRTRPPDTVEGLRNRGV